MRRMHLNEVLKDEKDCQLGNNECKDIPDPGYV